MTKLEKVLDKLPEMLKRGKTDLYGLTIKKSYNHYYVYYRKLVGDGVFGGVMFDNEKLFIACNQMYNWLVVNDLLKPRLLIGKTPLTVCA